MDSIAIIGMACRFPGAADLDGFWRLLRGGVDAVREVPPDRWDPRRFPDASRWGGFLDRVDAFDPSFFGISPREAAYMDPQQRLLLEVAWEALEDAGLPLEQCSGRPTGVFVGISTYDYGARSLGEADRIADGYANTGSALSIAANRISYLFDFRGPSMAVDSACSSSLAAAHLACQSLGRGESEVALVGGVNLILSPGITIGFSKLKAMAADGRCKSFDARADGYVRGEGAGVVVLKRLTKAVADGDRVYAVIRGTALNQDGRTNGLTAPNGLAQEALIRRAIESAGIEPATIGYVEAHGTGTPLGDPIELTALGAVLADGAPRARRCAVGSVKTNIGHLEAAAGVAGLIKLALSLRHREIPPSLHFQSPNPHIPFDTLPLAVQTTLAPWPDDLRPARGGVSSFGFGGTNVHMVLEEPPSTSADRAIPPEAGESQDGRVYLVPLSAKSPDALPALARAWRDHLQSSAPLRDLAFSAGRRRTHHEHRLALVARVGPEAAEHLGAFLAGEARPGLSAGRAAHGRRKKLAFVFPGQGAQWFGMARGLMEREPVFAAAIEECERAIRGEVGWSVRDELLADAGGSRLAAVDVIQPVLFAIQAGLAALWRSWGVEPDAVVGHSMGEVAAAYVAGALSLEAAASVICRRSRLLRRTSGRGAMAAVELSIEEARRALAGYEDRVSIAVNSSPSSTVLSGDPAALEEIIVRLEAQSVFCRRVKVDVASHSPQMDPLRAELMETLDGVRAQPGKLPLYSTVTGEATREPELDATYWVRNLREPVLFSDAVQRLVQDGHSVFLELSPHPILLPAIQQVLRHVGKEGAVLPSLRREEDEQAVMLGSLGALFTLGRPVRWDALYPAGRAVRLPSYPWQRERFWLDDTKRKRERGGAGHPLLGPHLRSAAQGTHFWDIELGTDTLPYLSDHRVQDAVVLPAAAYLEMALAAAREAFGPGPLAVEDVELTKALFIPGEDGRRLQLVLSPSRPSVFSLQFLGVPSTPDADASPPVLHATGTLRLAATEPAPPAVEPRDILARCPEASTAAEHYDAARKRGLEYGPAFQAVRQIQRRDGEAIARLRLSPDLDAGASPYQVHPALLDACFQVLAAALSPDAGGDGPYLPVGIASLRTEGPVPSGGEYWGHAVLRDGPPQIDGSPHGDVFLRDERGHAVLSVQGLRLKRLEGGRGSARAGHDDWLYEVSWRPASRPEVPPGRAPGGAAPSWIVFADQQGVGEALGALLEARGDTCVIVSRGETYESTGPRRYQLNAAEGDHFRRLLRDAFGKGALPLRRVVHLWSLDVPAVEGTATGALDAARDLAGLSVLHLVQSLVLAGGRQKPRLWLVTAGAQAVEETESVSVGQSLAWGLGRTVSHEHPELGCTNVDLGAATGADAATELFEEIAADDREDRVALRGSARYVARLVRSSAERMLTSPVRPGKASTSGPFRLEISAPGVLENLVLRAARREEPGPGQVEIQVEAAALNFSDVLLALGLIPALPDGSVPLGLECAGVVTAVGEGVAGLRAGDEVVAMPSPALGSHVVTAAGFVAPKPPGLGFEEAATLPVAFLTAYYALHHLGRLAAGERVLIHSASGGVGLAAVQIARQMKAEIYATAGTAEKRDFLRSLGIERVADSRSLAFADEVRAWTAGEGVDVVLNSLAGDAIARGMALLRPGGRFLELGKRDILQDTPLGLRLLRNNRAFFAIDLYALARDRPAQLASLLSETMRFIQEHAIAPLPFRTFPASQAESAFRHLAHGKHVGKVVISMRDPEVRPVPDVRGPVIRADATYLVTGGLGGLGLAVARWMVEEGARSLVLVGRRGPSPEARAALEAMERAGARVTVAAADVSDPQRLAAVLADIDERQPPLRGIVHAAGVLNDGILANMDRPRFESVMGAKVGGAWNLHELTAGRPLDFFILFSSAAGVLGSPGQGNYSAASAFLDTLAHHRRAAGLPALSIDWGPWSEVGLAARPDRGGRLAAQGMESLTPRQGVSVFAKLLKAGPAQVAVMPVDWREWRQVHRAAAGSPLLADFADEEAAGPADAGAPNTALTGAMLLAAGPEERQRVLEAHLKQEVARVLGLSISKLDVNQPLSTLGIDSLMAVELKNRIETDLKVSVPLIKVIQGPSVAELTALLLSLLAGVDASLAEAPETLPPAGRGKGESLLLSILALGEDERNG